MCIYTIKKVLRPLLDQFQDDVLGIDVEYNRAGENLKKLVTGEVGEKSRHFDS